MVLGNQRKGLADASPMNLVRKLSHRKGTRSQLGEDRATSVITAQYEWPLRQEACRGDTEAIFSMFKTQVTLKLHCMNTPVTLAIYIGLNANYH